jgi:hypothetical protein
VYLLRWNYGTGSIYDPRDKLWRFQRYNQDSYMTKGVQYTVISEQGVFTLKDGKATEVYTTEPYTKLREDIALCFRALQKNKRRLDAKGRDTIKIHPNIYTKFADCGLELLEEDGVIDHGGNILNSEAISVRTLSEMMRHISNPGEFKRKLRAALQFKTTTHL